MSSGQRAGRGVPILLAGEECHRHMRMRGAVSLRDYYADEELFIARTCGRDDGTGPCDEVLIGDDRCPYHDENGEVE